MNNSNNISHRRKPLLSRMMLGLLFLLVSMVASGQATYPVQSYTQLIPPYTSNVPSFYSGTKEKLVCTLINTDMQHPSIQVYLRMKITSSIFSIETPPQVFTPPFELQAGVPVRLSLNDLAVYFARGNMRITGGQNEFFRTQQLPDNFYRFHFEVYETKTNRLLSNPKVGYAQAMIAAGEPPILNLPKMGEVITENNIPNIFFSWTPRHMNSVASAYGTEYEITLVEIPDKTIVPENAFLFSRRLYNETIRSTSFIHTTAQPQLIPGMRYGWRVQAKAKEGIEDVNVFHNEGFSPIFWFDYKADCKPVQTLGAVYENRRMVVTWVANEAIDYTVEYRKRGSYQWYTGTIVEGACPIFNLKNGETYEYRVGSRCVINDDFVYSEIKACTIPDEEARTPQCGVMPNANISNKTPLPILVNNLPVFAGDFPVVITEVQGSNGRFTGKGYVGVPYLGKARVAVVFNNILVNTSFQLVDGYFETVYDAKNNLIVDIDEQFTGGSGVGDIRSGEELAAYKVDHTIDPKFPALPKDDKRTQDEINEGKPYVLTKSENGFYEFILTDADGNKKEVKTPEIPVTIEDKKGDIYQVSENGDVKLVSTKSDVRLNEATKEKIRADIAVVGFESLPTTRYALDIYNEIYDQNTSVFEKYQLKDEVSKIPASVKFIVPGASDELFVRVNRSNAGFDFDKVRFITGVGKEYKGTPKEDKSGWNLTVVSSEANDGQEIYVVQQTIDGSYATLAKLNVFSYTPQETTINLVAVNGYELGGINEVAAKLNTIYNKIGLDIKVNIIKDFYYAPLANGEPFSVTGSGLFSQYTSDMKALNTAFKTSSHYEEGMPYLFMVKNKAQGVDKYVLGDMPRNKQFGYLFSGADYKTVAHEIGHGMFHLQHLDSYFKDLSDPHIKNNVMNYPSGDSFFKLQWDAIHSTGTVWGMFEKDEDGMSVSTSIDMLRPYLDEKTKTYTFITPSGNFIVLPDAIKNVSFSTLDRSVTLIGKEETSNQFPIGSLIAFTLVDGKQYVALINGNEFKGYYETISKEIYQNSALRNDVNKGIALFIGVNKQEGIVNYIGEFKSAKSDARVTNNNQGAGQLLDKLLIIPYSPSSTVKQTFYSYLSNMGNNLQTISSTNFRIANADKLTNIPSLERESGGKYTTEDLLKLLIDENSSIDEYLYYFTLVNLEESDLESVIKQINTLQECVAQIRLVDIQNSFEILKTTSSIMDNTVSQWEKRKTQAVEQIRYQAFKSNKILFGLQEAYFDGKKSKYETYYNLIKENYKAADVQCSFGALPIDIRIDVIDQLLRAVDNYWYINKDFSILADQSCVITELISTTPQEDRVKLLKEGVASNNYYWLKRLMNDAKSKDLLQIYSVLDQWVIENYDQLDIKVTTQTFSAKELIDGKAVETQYSYYPGKEPFYLGLVADSWITFGQSKIAGCQYGRSKAELKADGKIYFDQCYLYSLTSQLYAAGSSPKIETLSNAPVLNPFEPIKLIVGANYHELGSKQGDELTVTGFKAMLLNNHFEDIKSDRELRELFNNLAMMGAVIAAPATGGSSFAAICANISVAAGAVALTDNMMMDMRNSLTPEEYEKNIAFYNAWNDFHTSVMIVDGVAGGVLLIKGVYTTAKNWNKVIELCEDQNYKVLWGEAKEIAILVRAEQNMPLSKYSNIRKYLADGRTKAYLNNQELLNFELLLKDAHPEVLSKIDEFSDGAYFAEVVRGYKDNPMAFNSAISNLSDFTGEYGWLRYWNTSPNFNASLKTIQRLKEQGKLLPTGELSEVKLAGLNAYTVQGDFLNIPARYTPEWLDSQYYTGFKWLVDSGLDELAKVPGRRYVGEVYSGKAYSFKDFNSEFVNAIGKEHQFKGYVSSTKKKEVAEGFVDLTKKWIPDKEKKVAVIRRIKCREGVYIDDISDWGQNLGAKNHSKADPRVQVQEEVLMKEGYFKQTSEPIFYKKVDDIDFYYIDFDELVKPIQ